MNSNGSTVFKVDDPADEQDEDVYTINDEKSKLIQEEKLGSKSYSSTDKNETRPASTSKNSSSNANLFGISNTRTCPTCNGTGKVNKDEQDKLVALIPLNDNRLKPKRIWLWILCTVIVCLLIASALIFILAPRNIYIQNKLIDLHPYNISLQKDFDNRTIGLNIFFEETYEVTNNNYYEVHMSNLTLELNRISRLTAPKISYTKNLPLKPRSSTEVVVKVSYLMYAQTDPYVKLCLDEVINELFALVTTTFSFNTLWNNRLEVQAKNTQYLYCTNSSIVHRHIGV